MNKMEDKIEKIIERAIKQGKLLKKEDLKIIKNSLGFTWISWKSVRRSYRFTIFEDGSTCPGFMGK